MQNVEELLLSKNAYVITGEPVAFNQTSTLTTAMPILERSRLTISLRMRADSSCGEVLAEGISDGQILPAVFI